MANLKCFLKRNPIIFTAKIFGVLTLAFCIGTMAGMFLPIAFIAAMETLLLILLAYLCLFKW